MLETRIEQENVVVDIISSTSKGIVLSHDCLFLCTTSFCLNTLLGIVFLIRRCTSLVDLSTIKLHFYNAKGT